MGRPQAGSDPMDDPVDHRERVYRRYLTVSRTMPDDAPQRPAHELRRLVRQHFPKDREARVLDLGCGRGALLAVAREAGYRNATGIDRSPEQVETARRFGIEGVREGDLLGELAALAPASVDAIVTYDVLEHLTMPELLAVVDGVERALRPGGRWLIHVPNAEGLFGMRIRYGDITHETAFTRHTLAQLLLASGFGQVSCFEDRPVPHGVKSTIRLGLWHLIRLVCRFVMAVGTGDTGKDALFTQCLLAVATKPTAR